MVTRATFLQQLKARQARSKKKTLEPRHPSKPYPRLLERRYERQLVGAVQVAADTVTAVMFPRLPRIVEESLNSSDRFDDYVDTISALMTSIKVIFKAKVPDSSLEAIAANQAQAVNVQNSAAFSRQVFQVVGVKPFVAEPWLVPTMKSFTKNNVSLISSVHESYFKDVENVIYQGLEQGLSTKDIQASIVERTGVSKSRARLIARDQTGKLNSNLSMKRATGLGVKKFRWVTSADERVRSSHAVLNNKIFTYKDGAIVNGKQTWPGQDIQCRCTAVPILSSIEELPIAA